MAKKKSSEAAFIEMEVQEASQNMEIVPDEESEGDPALKAVGAAINKKMKGGSVPTSYKSKGRGKKDDVAARVKHLEAVEDDLRMTGIIALDVVLGGGYCVGDMHEVASPPGAGKTTALLTLAKQLIVRGHKVGYADVEKGVKVKRNELDEIKVGTPSILDNLGLTPHVGKEFLIYRPTTFSEVDDVFQFFIQEGCTHLMLDSIKGTTNMSLGDGPIDYGTQRVGGNTMVVEQFLVRWKGKCRQQMITMWLINQMRTKLDMKNPFLNGPKAAGGYASRHTPDVLLEMSAGQKMTRNEKTINGIEKVPYGNAALIWANKIRNERPFIKVPIPLIFGQGVSNVWTLREIMKEQGFIVPAGGNNFKITWGNNEVNVSGVSGLNAYIKENTQGIFAFLKTSGLLSLTSGVSEDDE